MAAQPGVSPGKRGRRRDGSPWRTWDRWQWPALLVIAAVAAVADAWDMTSDGLEVYYAAGVRSMAGNWHAFLYDSFDPSRGITLDKLPGPFWVQALSVRAFGMSVWAMVLPQVVWSVLTAVVLFLAVRRVAGPVTGLRRRLARLAAAALAYTRQSPAALASAGPQTHPGWDRLLSAPLAQVTGWFLVPALIVAVAGVVTVVFSASEEVQSYYFGILSPAIAALCALGAKAALDRFGAFPWRLGFTLGVTGAALWTAVVLFEAGAAWHATALGIGAAALVAGAAAGGLTAAGPPGQRARIALGRISLALTLAAGLASPVIADCWLVMHRAGPFDIPLSPSGTFAQSTPPAVAARVAHPGYDGTILGEVTAATWQRFQTLGPEYNNGIPPGTWLAVYSSAAASNYVLAGVQRVLPIGGFTGSAPTPAAGQLTEMLSRHQIIMAIIPGPGDPRYNDPRVQAVVKHCGQLSGFGDTTAKAQLYTCLDA